MINLYGIFFVDDNHVEILASGCIHLECLALNFCTRVKGSSFKTLLQRCKKLQCLLLQNTGKETNEEKIFFSWKFLGIEDNGFLSAEWETSSLTELDLSSTELSEECLINVFNRMPKLTFLAVPNCDGFTDQVLDILIEQNKLTNLRAIDLSHTVNLNFENVFTFLKRHGRQLRGLSYSGNPKITEQFWINAIRHLKNIR